MRWDRFFGWKWSDRCPLFPFMGTYKHHPPVFCPPATERQTQSLCWCIGLHSFTYWFASCPQFTSLRLCNTHVCRAFAEQYFLFLSASLSWPFLQHWPQTNIIFRFGGPNLLCGLESCWWHWIKIWSKSLINTKQEWHKNTSSNFIWSRTKSNLIAMLKAMHNKHIVYKNHSRKTQNFNELLVKSHYWS